MFLPILHQLFLFLPSLSDIWRSLPSNDAERPVKDALRSTVWEVRIGRGPPGFQHFHTYRQKVWEILAGARLQRADCYRPKLLSAPNNRALGQKAATMCRMKNDPDCHTIQTSHYLKLWWIYKRRGCRPGVINRFEEMKLYFRTSLLFGGQVMTEWKLRNASGNIAQWNQTLCKWHNIFCNPSTLKLDRQ